MSELSNSVEQQDVCEHEYPVIQTQEITQKFVQYVCSQEQYDEMSLGQKQMELIHVISHCDETTVKQFLSLTPSFDLSFKFEDIIVENVKVLPISRSHNILNLAVSRRTLPIVKLLFEKQRENLDSNYDVNSNSVFNSGFSSTNRSAWENTPFHFAMKVFLDGAPGSGYGSFDDSFRNSIDKIEFICEQHGQFLKNTTTMYIGDNVLCDPFETLTKMGIRCGAGRETPHQASHHGDRMCAISKKYERGALTKGCSR